MAQELNTCSGIILFRLPAYTMAKYGMSMCVLGMSEEFKSDGIAVNALWPQTGENLYDIYQNLEFIILTFVLRELYTELTILFT